MALICRTFAKVNAKTQSANRKTLLYLGRLHPKKNISNLIRAWNETFNSQRGSGDRWVLAIAGWDQGGYESELKRIAAGTSVVFLGPQFGADKSECYRACDAFILPSLSEGLPMAVLEAWSYAKPVLMTPECNLPEGFEANAALRIGTTPEEIAAGLKVLREMSDDDRSQMGNRGRALVATRFSWPRIGEQMRAVYEWVLGGGAAEDVRLRESRVRVRSRCRNFLEYRQRIARCHQCHSERSEESRITFSDHDPGRK